MIEINGEQYKDIPHTIEIVENRMTIDCDLNSIIIESDAGFQIDRSPGRLVVCTQ